jgi:hypothetical protein
LRILAVIRRGYYQPFANKGLYFVKPKSNYAVGLVVFFFV